MVWHYVNTEEILRVRRGHEEDTRNVNEDWKCTVGSHVGGRWAGNGHKTPGSPRLPGMCTVYLLIFFREHIRRGVIRSHSLKVRIDGKVDQGRNWMG